MKTPMFVDEAARAKILAWFEEFRSTLPFSTEARRVATSFGETHLLVTGPEDAPPLVVLHGALASSAHLMKELGSLVNTHRIYAIDVMGQSVMSAERRIELDASYGRWLVEVIDALGLDRVAVMGGSWGGFVATMFAAVAPTRVSALVLMVPAGFVKGPAWRGFTEIGWPMMMYRLMPSPARLRRLVDGMFTTHDDRWMRYMGDAFRSYRLDIRVPPLFRNEDVAAYTGPTLVFGAERDVWFPGEALNARAKELFANVETVLLAECKHVPSFEKDSYEAAASAIDAFLKRSSKQQRAA